MRLLADENFPGPVIRRLRRILPGVSLLGGYWKHDENDAQRMGILGSVQVDGTVTSLAEAITYCLVQAAKDAGATAAKPVAAMEVQDLGVAL